MKTYHFKEENKKRAAYGSGVDGLSGGEGLLVEGVGEICKRKQRGKRGKS